ncbi:MAG: hypothetical protein KJ065_01155 [Anaerolineae bacterium]|nr:hypothetical protein [Anaerolineae bacterium]
MNEALQRLIVRWESFAQEANAQLRQPSADPHTRIHYHAVAETYRQAAKDLRAALEGISPTSDDQMPAPTAFLQITLDQANALLRRAGLNINTIYIHDDGAMTAVFPRLQPYSQEERSRRLYAAESRVTILNMGKMPDTGDPYIDFAVIDEQ